MDNLSLYLDPILTALAPVLSDLLAVVLSILLGALFLAVRRFFGLRAEALLRDALNQALATGVKQAPPTMSAGEVASAAVEYAKRSSPEAIRKLKAPESVLLDKARSIARDVLNR